MAEVLNTLSGPQYGAPLDLFLVDGEASYVLNHTQSQRFVDTFGPALDPALAAGLHKAYTPLCQDPASRENPPFGPWLEAGFESIQPMAYWYCPSLTPQ